MAKFQVLAGKALASAIAGRAKAVATFTEREHQLAYSALNHVELHNDAKYLNALFDVTPANYRKGLVSWATAFGKVSFDSKERAFAYAKGKKSDMDQAMEIAPANYEKAKGEKPKAAFDEVTYLERVIKKMDEEGASPRVMQAMKGVLAVAKSAHLTVAAESKPARQAKPQVKPETQNLPVAA